MIVSDSGVEGLAAIRKKKRTVKRTGTMKRGPGPWRSGYVVPDKVLPPKKVAPGTRSVATTKKSSALTTTPPTPASKEKKKKKTRRLWPWFLGGIALIGAVWFLATRGGGGRRRRPLAFA